MMMMIIIIIIIIIKPCAHSIVGSVSRAVTIRYAASDEWKCVNNEIMNWKGFGRNRSSLTLNSLTWKIWWAPNNASRWQMGFNSAFKGLRYNRIYLNRLRKTKNLSKTSRFAGRDQIGWLPEVNVSVLVSIQLDLFRDMTLCSLVDLRGIKLRRFFWGGGGNSDVDTVADMLLIKHRCRTYCNDLC